MNLIPSIPIHLALQSLPTVKSFYLQLRADYISVIDIDSVRTILAGTSSEVRKQFSNNLESAADIF